LAISGNYVYLGDGWVLSARHYGYNPSGITFQTANGPVTYRRIPGSYYKDYGYLWTNGEHFYAVSNPTSIQTETGQTVALSEFTDLQLFRIDGDPGLPSVPISTGPLPQNLSRATGPHVFMAGNGPPRTATQSQWNVVQHSQGNWTWTPTSGSGTHQGYFVDTNSQNRWGTNRLTDPRPNGPGDPPDSGAMDYSNLFNGIISDNAAVLPLTTGDGVTRDVIAAMTVYDQQGQPGTMPPPFGLSNLEAQAVLGDSGGVIFFKRSNQWELAGIVNASFRFPNQPDGTSIYGNVTMASNLWYYNQNYPRSIKNIIASHANYSIMGDVNLDGVVSGNGTGPLNSDDVSAFVAGWNYNNGLGAGTITSWKNGDLNRDGKTDVSDFLKLRGALNGQVSSAALTALFGAGAVPEPSTVGLAILAASLAAMRRQRTARLRS
jgi:hypothetical protein